MKYGNEIEIMRACETKAAYEAVYNRLLNPNIAVSADNVANVRDVVVAEFDTRAIEATDPLLYGEVSSLFWGVQVSELISKWISGDYSDDEIATNTG